MTASVARDSVFHTLVWKSPDSLCAVHSFVALEILACGRETTHDNITDNDMSLFLGLVFMLNVLDNFSVLPDWLSRLRSNLSIRFSVQT